MKNTNYNNLMALKKEWFKTEHKLGIIFGNEITLIKEMLQLNYMDLIDLQNCRDMTVMLFRGIGKSLDSDCEKITDLSSAIECVIDEMKKELENYKNNW